MPHSLHFGEALHDYNESGTCFGWQVVNIFSRQDSFQIGEQVFQIMKETLDKG